MCRMMLYFSIDVVIDFICFAFLLSGALFALQTYRTSNIRTYFYWGLTLICLASFFALDGFAIMFLNTILGRIEAVVLFPTTISFIITVNYALRESYNTVILIPIFSLGAVVCYLAFQPGMVAVTTIDGFTGVIWVGLFDIFTSLFFYIVSIYAIFWVLKIWLNAPFEIKREATILLVSMIILVIIVGITNILITLNWALLWSVNLSFAIIFPFIIFSIRKEPKLLFVLPFTPYKIIVSNRKGVILFEHLWAKSKIGETLSSRFLTPLQQQTQEKLKTTGLVNIHLKEGIILFYESEKITVNFIISQSSKFLVDLVEKFSLEFEEKFKKLLEESCEDASQFEAARELIVKHFSMFPSRLIDEEKEPLFLSKDVYQIPPEIEAKLRRVLKNEEEFELVKCEIQRSFGEHLASEFLALYKELTEESEQPEEEESD